MDKENVLEVKKLEIDFETFAGPVHAIRNVSFNLKKGENFAIVGESGSGKSVTVRSVMNLLSKNAIVKNGEILYKGDNLLEKTDEEMQKIRGDDIAMIFQDPMTSLNPVMRIGDQVAEPIRLHQNASKKEANQKALDLLEKVGIPNAKNRFKDYPHQFSGGQRQRIVIAIALACEPEILIADEPTTALDVTIQAQILDLIKDLQVFNETSIIFITHDLGVVANVADRIGVMYAGQIVEYGTVDEIFYNPQHPYTWGLITSMPTLETEGKLLSIPGTPPDLHEPPKGDAFAPRSEYAMQIDYEMQAPYFHVSPTHAAATWLLHPDAPAVDVPEEIERRYGIYGKLKEERGLDYAASGEYFLTQAERKKQPAKEGLHD